MMRIFKARSLLVVCLCLSITTPIWASDGFLEAKGAKLYLDGKEFKEIGFNFYQAFRWYLDLGWDYPKGQGRQFARSNLDTLAEHGFRIIRVMGPFGAGEYEEVFFDNNPEKQAEKRRQYLTSLNQFLDDCEQRDIWIDFSLVWEIRAFADLGHHSLHELMVNPRSLGYRRLTEYIQIVSGELAKRRKIILEDGNEYNLLADLKSIPEWAARGVITETPSAAGPVYRGPDNNFNSYELAAFFKRLNRLVRSVDGRHLIVTGNAEPPENAMQRLRVATQGGYLGRAKDTPKQRLKALALTNQSADLVASHYYINENIGVRWYQQAAEKLDKPLFMGEVGPHFKRAGDKIAETNYADPEVVKDMDKKLADLVEAGVPISLIWTYDCSPGGDPVFKACYGRTDDFLYKVELANKLIKKRR